MPNVVKFPSAVYIKFVANIQKKFFHIRQIMGHTLFTIFLLLNSPVFLELTDSSLISLTFILNVIQPFLNNQLRTLSARYVLDVVSSRSLRWSSSESFLFHLKCPDVSTSLYWGYSLNALSSLQQICLPSGAPVPPVGAHLTSCSLGNGRAIMGEAAGL